MSTAERREAALTRFRTELGREPTEDELSLLHETGALQNRRTSRVFGQEQARSTTSDSS